MKDHSTTELAKGGRPLKFTVAEFVSARESILAIGKRPNVNRIAALVGCSYHTVKRYLPVELCVSAEVELPATCCPLCGNVDGWGEEPHTDSYGRQCSLFEALS